MSYVKKTFVFIILAAAIGTGQAYSREIKWWYKLSGKKSLPPVPGTLQKKICPGCNLILISLDTLRADRMGFLGSKLGLTPNLDRIATNSIHFSNAFTNAFFTTPSHMTAFTSLYPTTHRVESTDVRTPRIERSKAPAVALDLRFKTLAEIMRQANYDTVWAAPLNFKFLSFKDGFGRGFARILPPIFTRGLHFPLGSAQKIDEAGLAKVFPGKKKPFFAFLHSYVTHLPYAVGKEVTTNSAVPYHEADLLVGIRPIMHRTPETLFLNSTEPGFNLEAAVKACQRFENMNECFSRYLPSDQFVHRVGNWQLRQADKFLKGGGKSRNRDRELANYIFAYDYQVAALDRQIGDLWDWLENSGNLKNTVVVIFSDHGEELYEHGEGNHSSFFEHTARIPWLIHFPGEENSVPVTEDLVSLVDLMPTVLDILEIKAPDQVQGRSVFTNPAGHPYVFGAALGVTYVRDHEWKLVQAEQGKTELYNVRFDRLEKENLIDLKLGQIRVKTQELEQALADFRLMQSL